MIYYSKVLDAVINTDDFSCLYYDDPNFSLFYKTKNYKEGGFVISMPKIKAEKIMISFLDEIKAVLGGEK